MHLCYKRHMPRSLRLLFILLVKSVHSHRNLLLKNLALRQQLAILKQKRPHPRFTSQDKLFWVILRRLWPGWRRALILVRRRLLGGIGRDSSCIGPGSRGIGHAWEEDALASNCANSSSAWSLRTPLGVRHAFTEKSKWWASIFRSEPCCAG
jgi:hypothetical protein